jgi:tetratricopeptide (TPR) repeat protein
MNSEFLVALGNEKRAELKPEQALNFYAQAFAMEFDNANAWNNYGNVIREMGYPQRSIPFLQTAINIDPSMDTAHFNLAVSYLLAGDYEHGWPAYEARWNFEHLAGTLPNYNKPRWTGQDLTGKTILVVGEQGHGDCIQFVRFVYNLHQLGARVLLQVTDGLIPLLNTSNIISWVGGYLDTTPDFDYWVPIMSIPELLGIRTNNIPQIISYLGGIPDLQNKWLDTLGPKKKMRIGFSWSGRRDTWINQHKSVPFEKILKLVKSNPQYQWINLQIDCTDEEALQLINAGATLYPDTISNFADTASLISHCDVIVSVDTAISHLAGALGRPTWIMLNRYGVDWRWLLDRDNSPWYVTAKLFRQPEYSNWDPVLQKISKWLELFRV